MPEGVSIKERATLVGYFFKLQGYLEAKAKPRSAPLKAPLLIGRLSGNPLPAKLLRRHAWNGNKNGLGGEWGRYTSLTWASVRG